MQVKERVPHQIISTSNSICSLSCVFAANSLFLQIFLQAHPTLYPSASHPLVAGSSFFSLEHRIWVRKKREQRKFDREGKRRDK